VLSVEATLPQPRPAGPASLWRRTSPFAAGGGEAGVASLRCITAPTPTVRAPLRHSRGCGAWFRTSASITCPYIGQEKDGAEATARDPGSSYDLPRLVGDAGGYSRGFWRYGSRQRHGAGRRAPRWAAFAAAVDIEVLFDEQRFVSSGLYLSWPP
jgi:hypothetical protein